MDDFDATKDVWKGVNEAYAAIRARKAAGGPGWKPKEPQPDLFSPREPRRPNVSEESIPREVMNLFVSYAIKVRNTGFARYSADAILHRIRWHYHMEKKDREFKCNNNWTSGLARWAMASYPELTDFFETRASPNREKETS